MVIVLSSAVETMGLGGMLATSFSASNCQASHHHHLIRLEN